MTASDVYARRLHEMTAIPAPVPAAFEDGRAERRDSLAEPGPFLQSFFTGGGQAAGVTVTETTAMTVSGVFACVRNIAEDEAKLPFITYRKVAPRGKQRLPDHPLYRLLHDEPNPEMTAFSFRQAVTASAVLWGGGYAEIERTNGGTPLHLWPIEPWRVCPRRVGGRGGRLVYVVDGRTTIEPADMLHIPGFSLNGVLGYMVSQAGRDSLGLAIAAQRFASNYFANGSRFSGILSHPKLLSPEARANLLNSFTADTQGPNNAFKVKLIEEGLTWTQMSAPPNEAQLLESRMFQIEEVARWFRMPPHKIQHLERSTNNNIEQQSIEYVTDTLMPWLVRWEQECRRKLVSPGEPDVFAEHLVNGLLRGDSAARGQFYKTMREIGAYSADDVRELENENPLADGQGDVYLVPLNMVDAAKFKAMDPATTFKREVVKAFIADGTVSDVIANSTNIGDLVGESGLPRNAEYKEPYLPVTAEAGPLVSGAVIKDADGDVVGGDVLPPPQPQQRQQDAPPKPEPEPAPEPVAEPEPAPHAPPDGGGRGAARLMDDIRAAHRPAFMDAAIRVVRRELEVLRKKATSAEAVEKFFAEHATYARTVFRPAAASLEGCRAAVLGEAPEPAEITIDFAPFVRELSEAVAAGRGADVLDRWEREKAEELVRSHLNIERRKAL